LQGLLCVISAITSGDLNPHLIAGSFELWPCDLMISSFLFHYICYYVYFIQLRFLEDFFLTATFSDDQYYPKAF
jgi:hypothetical protein